MLRTAIYGGSFNPIHLGHIRLGEWICQQGYADELWFMVSPLNPLKEGQSLLPDEQRLELARLAIEDKPHLMVSDFEMSLPRPSFMVNTLEALRTTYPEREFILVIGADNWLCFSQWHNYQEILLHYRILVYPRPGFPVRPESLPHSVQLIDAPLYDISSTEIRNAIAQGDYDGAWLSEKVWERIKQQKYYESPKGCTGKEKGMHSQRKRVAQP